MHTPEETIASLSSLTNEDVLAALENIPDYGTEHFKIGEDGETQEVVHLELPSMPIKVNISPPKPNRAQRRTTAQQKQRIRNHQTTPLDLLKQYHRCQTCKHLYIRLHGAQVELCQCKVTKQDAS